MTDQQHPPDADSPAQTRGSPDGATGKATDDAYEVPPDGPVYECRYCGRPFARESFRTLHRGLEHAGELTDEERTAFRDAYREEYEQIRLFRLKALGALVVLYFGLLMVYALV